MLKRPESQNLIKNLSKTKSEPQVQDIEYLIADMMDDNEE